MHSGLPAGAHILAPAADPRCAKRSFVPFRLSGHARIVPPAPSVTMAGGPCEAVPVEISTPPGHWRTPAASARWTWMPPDPLVATMQPPNPSGMIASGEDGFERRIGPSAGGKAVSRLTPSESRRVSCVPGLPDAKARKIPPIVESRQILGPNDELNPFTRLTPFAAQRRTPSAPMYWA